MWGTGAVLVVAISATAGLAHAQTATPSDLTIKATAPLALNDSELGRPFSNQFEPLIGKEGKTLFPGAKTKRTDVNASWYTFQSIDSSHEFRANARVWIIDASGSSAKNTRYAVYRAIQVTHAIELNDTDDPRAASGDAAYYLRKIYYGRVYEVVFSGSADVFTAEVRAGLLTTSGMANFERKYRQIRTQVFSRGLEPKHEALFAQTPREIRDAYLEDKKYNAGKPVPVLVEYRRVPGARLDGYEEIEWKTPTVSTAQLKIRQLVVDGTRQEWTDTGLTLQPNDVLIGAAEGSVVIGSWSGARRPETTGEGRLEINVDGDVRATGKSWTLVGGKKPGSIKLRVKDSKYTDNSGEYAVKLMLIPADAVTRAECVVTQAAGDQPCSD